MAQLDDYVPVPDDNPDAAGGAASQDVTDDDDALPLEEEEGEDLMENMQNDYRAMSGMDQYEADGLDQEYTEQMTYEERAAARLAAEAALDRRDAGGRRRKRMPGALEGLDDDDFADVRRRRLATQEEDDGDEGPPRVSLEEFSGCVTDWVANPPVAAEVQRRFRRFLRQFQDDKGQRVYLQRIEAMVLGEGGGKRGRV
ncbi:hypothetical protein MNEG_7903 [Monoraphidium neglectum]|uniref:DNA replication licensing factor MCM2 n=1 Tax=Monoraphidium neglectum TaxID=145388 RepID=A0A0D2MHA1_9CHLO|nr:hypothetical protein MNEG_7903 [Monoraphidium neglectum]KIZ00062.1 hypothetical protein MNEG_7903 [Monoraphidium neglectum]|eukprot:XP_013899081.1 hypothetical protein MNEG_7903 [Monoraphidium neglectum]